MIAQEKTSRENQASSPEAGGARPVQRLTAMIAALSDAQQLANSNGLDARIQIEFRHALDHIRQTASAVQQWFEAADKSADPYAVLPVLAAQRVNRTSQLAKDLSTDLANMDVTVETQGLQDLYQAVGQLHRQLDVLCKHGK
ncbi:MAG TPA: hypothetical protein VMF66_11540 [Candidatus Acidoferrum sp.]|nr:hypothetical protein [Candidatus Acidoferrum sp.]